MGRAPCCDKTSVKKGPWSPEEDAKLKEYIEQHGTGGNWIALPKKIGLKRCGKSCRLRWLNYLRPNLKHGGFSEEEENIICSLYMTIGSRWSIIAAQLPGRTDNDIKNYWNTRLKQKLLGTKNRTSRRSKHHQEHVQLDSSDEHSQYFEIMNSSTTQGYTQYEASFLLGEIQSMNTFQNPNYVHSYNMQDQLCGPSISYPANLTDDMAASMELTTTTTTTVKDDMNSTVVYPYSAVSDYVDCKWQDMLIGSEYFGLIQQGQMLFN